MRKFTTTLCSIAFAVSGICLAVTESNKSLSMPGNMTAVAQPVYPTIDISKVQLPKDLSLDLKKQKSDTVFATKHDTVYVTKNVASNSGKVRVRVKYRTLYKSKLYIAIPSDKGSSVDSTDFVYHLHKVDNPSVLK